jgi:hypothetical protein
MNPEIFAFGIMVVTSLLAVLATATAIRSIEGSKRPAATRHPPCYSRWHYSYFSRCWAIPSHERMRRRPRKHRVVGSTPTRPTSGNSRKPASLRAFLLSKGVHVPNGHVSTRGARLSLDVDFSGCSAVLNPGWWHSKRFSPEEVSNLPRVSLQAPSDEWVVEPSVTIIAPSQIPDGSRTFLIVLIGGRFSQHALPRANGRPGPRARATPAPHVTREQRPLQRDSRDSPRDPQSHRSKGL